mmetsp:Transcript_23389/g.44564  ORF Transcript_23389/g.44564 Transcript_23389/m.44564 type:complete len:221 (+) Transcript_23389:81-743(+)
MLSGRSMSFMEATSPWRASSPSATSPERVTSSLCGLGHTNAVCCSTASVSVADTITVCRPPSRRLPHCSAMRVMSAILVSLSRSSTSSNTRMPVWWVLSTPSRDSSAKRPGVPTTTKGLFLRMASTCLLVLAPPMACCTMLRRSCPTRSCVCRTICMASSLEGTTTSMRSGCDMLSSLRSRSMAADSSGSMYARVLPEPVCDCKATLYPPRMAGKDAACT